MVTPHVYSENHIKVDSVVIKKAPWHILTPTDVTCINFDDDISYKEYHISDSIVISDIVRELSCLKESQGKSLDVRCKIYFYSHGKAYMSACIGPSRVLYDGALYFMSPSLKKKIDSLIKNSTSRKPLNKGVHAKREFPFPNGRDSLYSYLQTRSDEFIKKIEKTVALTVHCQIDSHGNTIKVTIRNRDRTTPGDDMKELVTKLTEVFMNDIKWIPNKERFPYEVVSIPIRFMVEGDDIKRSEQ